MGEAPDVINKYIDKGKNYINIIMFVYKMLNLIEHAYKQLMIINKCKRNICSNTTTSILCRPWTACGHILLWRCRHDCIFLFYIMCQYTTYFRIYSYVQLFLVITYIYIVILLWGENLFRMALIHRGVKWNENNNTKQIANLAGTRCDKWNKTL